MWGWTDPVKYKRFAHTRHQCDVIKLLTCCRSAPSPQSTGTRAGRRCCRGRYQQNLTVAHSGLNDAVVKLKEEEKQKWNIRAVTYARTVTKRGHHKMTKAKTKYMYNLVETMRHFLEATYRRRTAPRHRPSTTASWCWVARRRPSQNDEGKDEIHV